MRRRRSDLAASYQRAIVEALLATDQIIFGIITIGVIGLISDMAFKRANRALFRWAAL